MQRSLIMNENHEPPAATDENTSSKQEEAEFSFRRAFLMFAPAFWGAPTTLMALLPFADGLAGMAQFNSTGVSPPPLVPQWATPILYVLAVPWACLGIAAVFAWVVASLHYCGLLTRSFQSSFVMTSLVTLFVFAGGIGANILATLGLCKFIWDYVVVNLY